MINSSPTAHSSARRVVVATACALLATSALACGTDPAAGGVQTTPGVPQVDTADNDAPIVRIDQPAQTVFLEPGAVFTVTGGVDDPDHTGPQAPVLRWDFGDGTTGEGPNPPPHVYAEPGEYLVTLAATDADGAQATPAVRLVEVGTPTRAQGNFALQLTGAGRDDVDRVKIPLDDPSGARTAFGANIGARDMTVEFWMKAAPGANAQRAVECGDTYNWVYGNIVVDHDRFEAGRSFGLSLAGRVPVFGVTGRPGESMTVCGTTPVDDGRWHHVALTRSVATGAMGLWLDGRLEGSSDTGPTGDLSYPAGAKPAARCPGDQPCTLSDPYLVIGAEKHDVGAGSPAFTGLVDELRLSNTIRYTAPFTPPTSRFTPDADTAALFHFDEDGGPIVRDAVQGPASPNDGIVRSGGGTVGPFWVPSEAPTGP